VAQFKHRLWRVAFVLPITASTGHRYVSYWRESLLSARAMTTIRSKPAKPSAIWKCRIKRTEVVRCQPTRR
jgi:hypothetical protein